MHGVVGSVGSTLGSIGTAVLLILMVAATVSLVLRFRRSTGVLRQQLKWFGAAAADLAVAAVVSPVLWAFSGRLRQEIDLEALNAEVLEVVRETLQPSFSSVWLRSPQ